MTIHSPMMEQWHACKKKASGAILLFRLGDFYEAFHEDAILIAKELEITLTKRQEIPMAGVPFHSSEVYLDKLIQKGYCVAIAEQMEDPKEAKGLVRREVVKILTPGTIVTSSLLSAETNNFLASITQVNALFGLSLIDITTADFRAMEFTDPRQLLDALSKAAPKELLLSEKFHREHPLLIEEILKQCHPTLHVQPNWYFEHQSACDLLLRHFHVHSLDGFGLKNMVSAINAAGATLAYIERDLKLSVHHIRTLTPEHPSQVLWIDRTTQNNLELVANARDGKKKHSLLGLLDHTQTPMGARLLKRWVLYPLVDPSQIMQRQDAIASFLGQWSLAQSLHTALNAIYDLERLTMRMETAHATPRDLIALAASLEALPGIAHHLRSFSASLIQKNVARLCSLSPLSSKIRQAIVDAPPARLSDGEVCKSGYHPELDRLRNLKQESHQWIANYQQQLRDTTQIKTLKVGYTQAFGFYIEVSRGQADRAPPFFQRKQTLVNAERFITPELKNYEYQILHAEERIQALECELFHELRKEVASHATAICQTAQALSQVDALLSLATTAKINLYVRPTVDSGTLFQIEEGRHPIIEATLGAEPFVPNDLLLDSDQNRLLLITGPNMAGKSTYIRQVALLAILAQIGSFIPAKSAHIGVLDKVFSRIGASDDLAKGQSTFMVEMAETASILHNVTNRSLVILDEIGRGTSTYDGISIAWAVAEYLLMTRNKQAKTLFATHYWELTDLEKKIPGARNYHVAVQESEGKILFLHKILPGGTDRSYGIHVARLAGLPSSVLLRAEQILKTLEKRRQEKRKPQQENPLQCSLFDD